MKDFSFSIPQNIRFGSGAIKELPGIAKKMGCKKAYIISGPHLKKAGLVDICESGFRSAGIEAEAFTETEGNPSTETVEKAAESFRKSGADLIVAFGGGSPIDVAKAVAVTASYGGRIEDYEGVGKVPGPVTPMVAIPTTAGTGSEVTAFSVITDHKRNYKLTVGSDYILPEYAILDPELIKSVPQKTAAACGIDAFVHALEAFISKGASPFSDMFAKEALKYIGKNIKDYVADRTNSQACEAMMLGSLFAGIAFSHARLGDVHAMSHPVSAYFNVPHGVANAILLPTVVDFNRESAKDKYRYIYNCVAQSPVSGEDFSSDMLAAELRVFEHELDIPSSLSEVGVRSDLFEKMADDAMKSGNIKVNPRLTTKADIMFLYEAAY